MKNVFKEIWGGIKVIAVHVSDSFKALFGTQAAKDFAAASLELLKSGAGQIVLSVVASLMNISTLSGPEKQAAAFSAAVPQLEATGITVGKNIAASEINLLIELAVSSLKGAFAPVTAPNLPEATQAAAAKA